MDTHTWLRRCWESGLGPLQEQYVLIVDQPLRSSKIMKNQTAKVHPPLLGALPGAVVPGNPVREESAWALSSQETVALRDAPTCLLATES